MLRKLPAPAHHLPMRHPLSACGALSPAQDGRAVGAAQNASSAVLQTSMDSSARCGGARALQLQRGSSWQCHHPVCTRCWEGDRPARQPADAQDDRYHLIGIRRAAHTKHGLQANGRPCCCAQQHHSEADAHHCAPTAHFRDRLNQAEHGQACSGCMWARWHAGVVRGTVWMHCARTCWWTQLDTNLIL